MKDIKVSIVPPIKGETGDIMNTSEGGTFYMNDEGHWVKIERINKWKELKKVLLKL